MSKGWERSWCFPHGSSILPKPRVSWEPCSCGGLRYGWICLLGSSPLAWPSRVSARRLVPSLSPCCPLSS